MFTKSTRFGALMLLAGILLGIFLGGVMFGTAEAQAPASDREIVQEMRAQTRALQSIDRNLNRLVSEVARQGRR